MSRAPSSRRNLIAVIVVLLALGLGTGLRLYAQNESPNVQHDAAWSYASAAGRMSPFLLATNGGLSGRWVPAGDWQYYWQSDRLSDLGNVGPDLAKFDVHPPLFFALLHVWLEVTGMHKWAGPAFNLVAAALVMLCIVGLARQLGFDRLEGALAALVWAVSPAVVSISSLTRQYDLVALLTVLMVWGLARTAMPRSGWRRWADVVWLTAATAAALLTHYQAVILVAGGALYAFAGVLLPRQDAKRRPWWPPLVGLAAGTGLAAILAPGWTQAFGREGSKLDGPSFAVFTDKLGAVAQTLGRFIAVPGLVVAVAAAIVIVLFAVPRTRRILVPRIRRARPGWWTILYFLLVTAGGISLQNLLFLSMPPLLSARYLAMAWPFIAFMPLLFFGIWPRLRTVLTTGFCLLVLLPATIATPLIAHNSDRMPIRQLANADAVLIDSVGVGVLPRFLWFVPGDTPVFAGTQEELLAQKMEWRSGALGQKAYYVSVLRAGAVRWRRNRILANLSKTNDVRKISGIGLSEIYEITPKAAPVNTP